MPTRANLLGNDIFVIHDFLTPAECEFHITLSETAGYDDAPITTSQGATMRKDIRNNDRAIIDDPALAAEWYERAKPFIPANFLHWTPVGLNERFRYYRYTAGQKFDWHMDGSFHRENGDCSRLTFMIYLNDACSGGETLFNLKRYGAVLANDPMLHVNPSPGKALVFRHDVLHTGTMVTGGSKYVVRTDVMFAHTASGVNAARAANGTPAG